MSKTLVKISAPYSEPWLHAGSYVTVKICKQWNKYGDEITETDPFVSKHSFGPIKVDSLEKYLQGILNLSKADNTVSEIAFEAPIELHEQLKQILWNERKPIPLNTP